MIVSALCKRWLGPSDFAPAGGLAANTPTDLAALLAAAGGTRQATDPAELLAIPRPTAHGPHNAPRRRNDSYGFPPAGLWCPVPTAT
jgi:hypothetical protein